MENLAAEIEAHLDVCVRFLQRRISQSTIIGKKSLQLVLDSVETCILSSTTMMLRSIAPLRNTLVQIHVLPPELISDILRLVVVGGTLRDRLKLTHVCRLWRDLLINDPTIWALVDISCRIHNDPFRSSLQLPFTEDYHFQSWPKVPSGVVHSALSSLLTRTKLVPISLRLDVMALSGLTIDDLDLILQPHANRIESLEIMDITGYDFMHAISMFNLSLPNLRNLSINYEARGLIRAMPYRIHDPGPSWVHVRDFLPITPLPIPPFSSLRSLYINAYMDASSTYLYTLFLSCPSLTHLGLRSLGIREGTEAFPDVWPLRLTSLILDFNMNTVGDISNEISRRFDLSSVKELEIQSRGAVFPQILHPSLAECPAFQGVTCLNLHTYVSGIALRARQDRNTMSVGVNSLRYQPQDSPFSMFPSLRITRLELSDEHFTPDILTCSQQLLSKVITLSIHSDRWDLSTNLFSPPFTIPHDPDVAPLTVSLPSLQEIELKNFAAVDIATLVELIGIRIKHDAPKLTVLRVISDTSKTYLYDDSRHSTPLEWDDKALEELQELVEDIQFLV